MSTTLLPYEAWSFAAVTSFLTCMSVAFVASCVVSPSTYIFTCCCPSLLTHDDMTSSPLLGFDVLVENDRGRIQEPNECENCRAKDAMELIINRSGYTNKQIIRMQETPDEIPEGETPNSLTLFTFDDLTDAVRPGDRVEVTGILRAVPRRVHPRLTTVRYVCPYIRAMAMSAPTHDTYHHFTDRSIRLMWKPCILVTSIKILKWRQALEMEHERHQLQAVVSDLAIMSETTTMML